MINLKNSIKEIMVLFIAILPTWIQLNIRRSYPYFEHLINIKKWEKIKGDRSLRIDYKLDESSVVFDLGGYLGKWSELIFKRYNCTIYVFEPCNKFANVIKDIFKDQDKVKVFNIGLGAKYDEVDLFVTSEGSSIYKKKGNTTKIIINDAIEFFKKESIHKIDLMKINIEGGEYDLLEYLINEGIINKINNIQVQFHYFIPNSWQRMASIQQKLSLTHYCTYNFPFVWENWTKNGL
ncbi:MAG TPA: FkbM family methyltransferase [Bacteroidales bacterium]|nr:FkbM family methyltransferase [Bacteroidales bacterium]